MKCPVINIKSGKIRKAARTAVVVLEAFCLTASGPLMAAAEETAPETDAVSAVSEVQDERLLGSKEARVFSGTLDSVYTLTTWDVKGQEDVPFVPLSEYMNVIFSDAYISSLEYAWEGNVYSITQNGQSILVDLDAQTVSCSNWREFQGQNAAGAIPAGIVEKQEFIALRPSVKNESTQTEPQGYEVSLADYGLEMIRYGDEVLLPFAAAQSVFGAPFVRGVFAYNGDDYFDIVSCYESIYGNRSNSASMNPYADLYYSGSFVGRTEMSEAYARYNYACMCLLLDLTYGHREEKGITSFDSYLEGQGLKDAFLTTDPKDDADSLSRMFNVLFDSGHDAELLSPSIFDSESIVGKQQQMSDMLELIGYDSVGDLTQDLEPLVELLFKLMNKLSPGGDITQLEGEGTDKEDLGPNVEKLMMDAFRMMLLKPMFYGNNKVEIIGDTCIIYFEAFKEDLTRSESFYTKLPKKSDLGNSSFALFYDAFDKIKKDGNVKKVVIDISNNGGGSAAALISLLGFLSEDGEVNFTYRDLLNGNYVSEYYHVDTNLDGLFDDEDGYGGQYDFYILTSGSSYSCGNALPYFAQRDHLARIIGQQPGGGDCVVGYYVDAAGHVGAISGFLQLGTMDGETFKSDETAVVPDLPFTDEEADEIYFHPDKIVEYISQHAD